MYSLSNINSYKYYLLFYSFFYITNISSQVINYNNLNTYKINVNNINELLKASIQNDTNYIQYLINHQKIDPNKPSFLQNKKLTLPLSEAVIANNISAIKVLLKNGANPYLKSRDFYSPFELAINHKNKNVVDIILDIYGIKGIDEGVSESENSYLTELIRIKNNEFAKLLIDKGVRVNPMKSNNSNENTYYFDSPLSAAIRAENLTMVKYLIHKGANINAIFSEPDEDCISCASNITIMHNVIYNSSISKKIVNYLLSLKPDLNIKNEDGFTPLDNICMSNDTVLANLYIQNGAKIESNKRTALFAAVINSNFIMAEFLLKKGANPNFRLRNNDTPLFHCYGLNGDGFGEGILLENRIKTMDVLLKYGANPNLKNNDNQSFKSMMNMDTNKAPEFIAYYKKHWESK